MPLRQRGAKRARSQLGLDLTATAIPAGQLTLSGPSPKLEAARWPVRGDLAHVRLAETCFVPHYAVPMPRVLARDAALKVAGHEDAETREELASGTAFNVLDIAGDWAWGQVGEDGCVGYVLVNALAERRG